MIYFASDFHLGHNRDFIYSKRGFSNIREHDNAILVEASKLTPQDTVYFLGDFSFERNLETIQLALNYFKCQLYMVFGNHDQELKKLLKNYKNNVRYYTDGFYNIKIEDKPITLCHFAMHSWDKSHFNTWHLYGHHHYPTNFGGKTLNVTFENTGKFFVSFDEVKNIMEKNPNNWDFIDRKQNEGR